MSEIRFNKSCDWVSSKGARTIQFIKTFIKENAGGREVATQEVITLTQCCLDKSVTIAIERRRQGSDGVFHFEGNPWAGTNLEPEELAKVIEALTSLQR
jgi:hypothetical protein